jgi:Ca2+-binding RTX toxin-like protein
MWGCSARTHRGPCALVRSGPRSPRPPRAAPELRRRPQTDRQHDRRHPCDDTIPRPRGITTSRRSGDDTLYGQRRQRHLFGGEATTASTAASATTSSAAAGQRPLRAASAPTRSTAKPARLRPRRRHDRRDRRQRRRTDTLSYATGSRRASSTAPAIRLLGLRRISGLEDGRGAYVNLSPAEATTDSLPPAAESTNRSRARASRLGDRHAFPDYIVGTSATQTIYGGGGADVILGEGGDDLAYGGADGD